jgi:hypothetical protein
MRGYPLFASRPRAPWLAAASVGAAIALGGASASAEAPKADVEAAEKLFTAAKGAMERGDLKIACQEFAESQRLDPAPGTLLDLGACEEKSGLLATALGHFQAARASLPAADFRVRFADDSIAALLRRVPRLAIRWSGVTGPETRVRRDDVDVAPSTFGVPLPVDPGAHQVVVTVSGEVVARRDVTAAEGQALDVDLSPTDAAPAAAGGSAQRTLGYVALGAGGLGFAVGVVFGVLAKVTYDSASSAANCPHGPTSCDGTGVSQGQSAHTQAAVATGAMVAGLALGGGGLALVLLAPKGAAVAVSPMVGAGAGGVSIGGGF